MIGTSIPTIPVGIITAILTAVKSLDTLPVAKMTLPSCTAPLAGGKVVGRRTTLSINPEDRDSIDLSQRKLGGDTDSPCILERRLSAYDDLLGRLKNKKPLAIIAVGAFLLVGLANVTDSISDLVGNARSVATTMGWTDKTVAADATEIPVDPSPTPTATPDAPTPTTGEMAKAPVAVENTPTPEPPTPTPTPTMTPEPPTPTPTSTPAPYAYTESDLEREGNPRFGFWFSYPRTWDGRDPTNGDGNTFVYPKDQNVRLLAWGSLTADTDIYSYVETNLGYKEDDAGFELLESVESGGHFVEGNARSQIPGWRLLYLSTEDGVDLINLEYMTLYDNRGIHVLFIAPAADFAIYEDLAFDLIRSLVVVPLSY